jgi:hypothetical protein
LVEFRITQRGKGSGKALHTLKGNGWITDAARGMQLRFIDHRQHPPEAPHIIINPLITQLRR